MEIGGRLPTATQRHQSFIKILTKHLAANKKVNFVSQQKSSTKPMMNPSPSELVELFSFVEVTLIQYATVAGHFPGVTDASVKPKPKKVNRAEVTPEEPNKGGDTGQCNRANHTQTKGQGATARHISDKPCSLLRLRANHQKPKREAKVEVRVSVENQNQGLRRESNNAFPSSEERARKETNVDINIR